MKLIKENTKIILPIFIAIIILFCLFNYNNHKQDLSVNMKYTFSKNFINNLDNVNKFSLSDLDKKVKQCLIEANFKFPTKTREIQIVKYNEYDKNYIFEDGILTVYGGMNRTYDDLENYNHKIIINRIIESPESIFQLRYDYKKNKCLN